MKKLAFAALVVFLGVLLVLTKPQETETAGVARSKSQRPGAAVEVGSTVLELPPARSTASTRQLGERSQSAENDVLSLRRAVFGSVTSSKVDAAASGMVIAWEARVKVDPETINRAISGESVEGIWIGEVAENGDYEITGLPKEGTVTLAALAPSSFSVTKTLADEGQGNVSGGVQTRREGAMDAQHSRVDLVLNAVYAAQFRVVDLDTGGAPFCSPGFFHGPRKKSPLDGGALLVGIEGQPLLAYLAHQLPYQGSESDPYGDLALLSSRSAEGPPLAVGFTLPGYGRGEFQVPSVPVALAQERPMELGVRRVAAGWGTAVVQLDDGISVAAAGLVGQRHQAVMRFELADGTHYGKSISLLGSPARMTLPAGTYKVTVRSIDDIARVGFDLAAEILDVPAGGEVELRVNAANLGHLQIVAADLRSMGGKSEVWIRIEKSEGSQGTRRITADAPFLFGMREGTYKMALWKMGGVVFRDQLIYSDPFEIQPGTITVCELPLP